MRACLGLLVLLAACQRPAPAPPSPAPPPRAPWPHFPATTADAFALLQAQTLRQVVSRPPPTPEEVFDAAARAGWSTLPSGGAEVRQFIERRLGAGGRGWLLFGTFHDSPDQVERFSQLVEVGGFDAVVLEQFRADGRWAGVKADQQRGDSELLRDYFRSGSPPAFAALSRAHDAHDYTAWKYGYASKLLRVVRLARGEGAAPLGCDLPAPLMVGLTDDDLDLRLRELHCKLAVGDAAPGAKKVAMLWGLAHIGPDGFRRFLPPADAVLALQAVGGRHSADTADSLLREKLVLNDEVLVPLGPEDAALLLPDRYLDGEVDRARDPLHDSSSASSVTASAEEPGTLRVGAVRLELGADEQSAPLAPGALTYAFTAKSGLTMVGSLELPPGADALLHFDPRSRSTRLWLRAAADAPAPP